MSGENSDYVWREFSLFSLKRSAKTLLDAVSDESYTIPHSGNAMVDGGTSWCNQQTFDRSTRNDPLACNHQVRCTQGKSTPGSKGMNG